MLTSRAGKLTRISVSLLCKRLSSAAAAFVRSDNDTTGEFDNKATLNPKFSKKPAEYDTLSGLISGFHTGSLKYASPYYYDILKLIKQTNFVVCDQDEIMKFSNSETDLVRLSDQQLSFLILAASQLFGNPNVDRRINFFQELIKELKQKNLLVGVYTVNSILRTMLDNGVEIDASQFLQKLISSGIDPNRETFELLSRIYSINANPKAILELLSIIAENTSGWLSITLFSNLAFAEAKLYAVQRKNNANDKNLIDDGNEIDCLSKINRAVELFRQMSSSDGRTFYVRASTIYLSAALGFASVGDIERVIAVLQHIANLYYNRDYKRLSIFWTRQITEIYLELLANGLKSRIVFSAMKPFIIMNHGKNGHLIFSRYAEYYIIHYIIKFRKTKNLDALFHTLKITDGRFELTNTCLPGISSSAACLHHHSESSLTLQSFLSDIPKETTLTANKSSKDNSNREIIFESGMKLLRYNQLNRFKEEIPCAKNNQFIERTRDNYFWLLVQEYCKKNIEFHDVLPIFSLYLSLFGRRFDADGGRIVLLDSVQNEKKPAESRLIFSQKTIFHLLNAAFDDFRSAKSIAMRELQSNCNNMRINMRADENSLQADCLENRDDNDYDDDDDDDESDANSFSLDVTNQRKHIYEIILNAIEEHDSPRKKRLFHGAVLLNRGNALEFVDEFKRSDQDISVDDLEYLCRLTENVKEANILASLTKVEEFLPQKDEVLAKIYEILALFYGQQRDLENLKGLCERLLSRRRRLRCYRHALHRIRHFYRCANAAAPPELTQAIARIDPSVRA